MKPSIPVQIALGLLVGFLVVGAVLWAVRPNLFHPATWGAKEAAAKPAVIVPKAQAAAKADVEKLTEETHVAIGSTAARTERAAVQVRAVRATPAPAGSRPVVYDDQPWIDGMCSNRIHARDPECDRAGVKPAVRGAGAGQGAVPRR